MLLMKSAMVKEYTIGKGYLKMREILSISSPFYNIQLDQLFKKYHKWRILVVISCIYLNEYATKNICRQIKEYDSCKHEAWSFSIFTDTIPTEVTTSLRTACWAHNAYQANTSCHMTFYLSHFTTLLNVET